MGRLTEAQRRALLHMENRQFASGEFYRRNLHVHPATISRLEQSGLVETNGSVHHDRIVDLHWRITPAGRLALQETADE